jgi:hypothetical protein
MYVSPSTLHHHRPPPPHWRWRRCGAIGRRCRRHLPNPSPWLARRRWERGRSMCDGEDDVGVRDPVAFALQPRSVRLSSPRGVLGDDDAK